VATKEVPSLFESFISPLRLKRNFTSELLFIPGLETLVKWGLGKGSTPVSIPRGEVTLEI
jgi:hypothetical protein